MDACRNGTLEPQDLIHDDLNMIISPRVSWMPAGTAPSASEASGQMRQSFGRM